MKLLHKSSSKNSKQSSYKLPSSEKFPIVFSIITSFSLLLSSPMSTMNSEKPYIQEPNLFDQSSLLTNTKLEVSRGNSSSVKSMDSREVIVLTCLRHTNCFQISIGFISRVNTAKVFLQHRYQKKKEAFAKEKLL